MKTLTHGFITLTHSFITLNFKNAFACLVIVGFVTSALSLTGDAAGKYNLSVKKPATTSTVKNSYKQPTPNVTPQTGYPTVAPTSTMPTTQTTTYPWQTPGANNSPMTTPQPTLPPQTGIQGPATQPSPFSSDYRAQQAQAVADARNARNVLIVLDASDSMNEGMEGTTKFQLAKRVLIETVNKIPPDVKIGLRVYGHRVPTSNFLGLKAVNHNAACEASDLFVPIAANNHLHINNTIQALSAQGMTPMTFSLQQAARDFNSVEGSKMIILISDGRETCSQVDPCNLALSMFRQGSKIKINTIGFALDDSVAVDQLKCVALSTKGRFYSAETSGQLADSLTKSFQSQASVRARIVD